MSTLKSPRLAIAMSLLVALAGGVSTSSADDAPTDATSAACRQETRRVAVWPTGNPKLAQHARFEDRLVTTCNETVSQSQRNATGEEKI